MIDFLRRLDLALPKVEHWIHELKRERSPVARRVSELRLPRVSNACPADILNTSFVQITHELPFPPVLTYGLPEFQAMAILPMVGITFGDIYFLQPEYSGEAIHFHELVHVIQWRALGVRDFLLTVVGERPDLV